MKVLMLSLFDYAGSGYRIAEAINTNSTNFVQYLVIAPTMDKYFFKRPPAVCFLNKEMKLNITNSAIERVNALAQDADIIHFKGDFAPDKAVYKQFMLPKKPTVITVSGSSFRIGEDAIGRGDGDFKPFLNNTDRRTALNPDLNYPDFDASYVPFAYDMSKTSHTWTKKEIPVIAHSPSTRGKKGTDLFLKACEELKDKYEFKVNIIENMPHMDCLEEKSEATIFFDQIGCGSYGNSAVEAMAFGIPTICHISEQSYKQSDGRLDNCPIVNCGETLESVKEAIESILNSDLEKLSKETREWCISEHGYENISNIWNDIYKEMLCQ